MTTFNSWVIVKMLSHAARKGTCGRDWSTYFLLEEVYATEQEALVVADSLPRRKGEWGYGGADWEGFQVVPEEIIKPIQELDDDDKVHALAMFYDQARSMRPWVYGKNPPVFPTVDNDYAFD